MKRSMKHGLSSWWYKVASNAVLAKHTDTPLPHPFPTSLRKTHFCEPPLLILLDTTFFPLPTLKITQLLSRYQIYINGFDETCALDNLPEEEHEDTPSKREVVGYKTANVEWHEAVIPDEHEHQDAEDQREVCAVRGPGGAVRQRGRIKALRFPSMVEADVGDNHKCIGHYERGRRQIDEPEEDLDGRVGRYQERDAGDQTDSADRVNGNASLRALSEDLRCLPI